jgi:hypothetical protein
MRELQIVKDERRLQEISLLMAKAHGPKRKKLLNEKRRIIIRLSRQS